MKARELLPRLQSSGGREFPLGLRRDFGRLFEDFFSGWDVQPPGGTELEFWPTLDLAESEGVYTVKTELPGMDEKAIEAVRKWKFRPGQKDGRPVTVVATVEVNFRLL